MRIKKLEIVGFKSFLEKAAIHFPGGISAIVGPNGCGKSNITDAIRWVMGEQSAKQLRGKSMDDVIFAGANGRPPLNMAEVSITLANENGTGPEEFRDYAEIMVTRRVYRSGERAYFINRRPCRLKDVHNVFMGSGIGTPYAIIQQGNIGAITDADPIERRVFLEEAAGITRFKNRKAEALRKVESTNQNLLRLADIIAEIDRQMGSLKRQARKAELFREYQEQIRTLDVCLALHHHARFGERISETEAMLESLRDADMGHTAEMKRIDAAIESIKFEREKKNQVLSDQKNRRHELQRALDRSESDLSHLRSESQRLSGEIESLTAARTDLDAKNEKIVGEIEAIRLQKGTWEGEIERIRSGITRERVASEELKTRQAGLIQEMDRAKASMMDLVAREAGYKNIVETATRNRETLQRRLKRMDEEAAKAAQHAAGLQHRETEARNRLGELKRIIGRLTTEINEAQERLKAHHGTLSDQIKTVQTLELEKGQVRSQHAALKKMETNLEWYRDGVRAVMKAFGPEAGASDLLGLTADVIEAEAGYEPAVEAVLGEALQYFIVGRRRTGIDAVAYLRDNDAGRGGFIPVSELAVAAPVTAAKADPLLSHVQVRPGCESVAALLLGGVYLAPDLPAALDLYGASADKFTVVTPDGDMLTREGVILGGSKERLSGILAKKRELKSLGRKMAEIDDRILKARDVQHRLEETARALESDLQRRSEARNAMIADEIEAEKAVYKVGEDLKHAQRQLEVIRLEQEQLSGEADDIEVEVDRTNAAVAQVGREIQADRDRVARLTGEIEGLASALAGFEKKIVDLKLNLTSANTSLENAAVTERRLVEFHRDGEGRLRQLIEDIERKTQKVVESRQRSETLSANLSGMYAEIRQIESELEKNEHDFRAIDVRIKESDQAIAEIQTRRQGNLEKIRILELELSQLQVRRDNIASRALEQHQKSIAALKEDVRAMPERYAAHAESGVDVLEMELERYRNRLSAIADVNLGAIREYEQLKERFDFLVAQREDLQKALNDLHTVIRKINKVTQERFLDIFDRVNEKMKEIFPKLFEGGTAKLVMTDPSQPLETGVEFMIHPPGKKLTRMSLLSGGEKALSAIAFIFSIFSLKPASFCIMDEIDAPLDDANVYRFNTLLKMMGERNQILMITHNKRSMEFADTLIGVTMENKGVSKIVSVNFEGVGESPEARDARDSAAA